MSSGNNNPFGLEINAQDVVDAMAQLKGWEDRYRQVIQWGKKLPVLDESLKQDQVLVAGCESSVWLVLTQQEGKWQIQADSDARIVRGLIAIVLAAFNGKTSEQILAFDLDEYFAQLNLINHLSPSRGNGLKAIVDVIKSKASE
ncbi:Sulfur acceptor protein CsdE [Vibrio mediterranei]|uniref:Cysteine desulfurase sulfur acceptor subunit CsdE n=1 Tax=Vibrio mediterranei TaxID=689 RepID=A0ABX5D9P1_9VIBR|nr:cysteine desulfurase sulfur acceptor subunit CsdE [Vibrio mediterranei]MCG9656962.1 cysteine desulfurase sulfur acceptor subunit CsdE [Vibrio mediterranei]MCG9662433.1 cysteine desulfurase sulfur acceptor subunit CsdE [Vibrio mediterranei]PCD87130.1 cysteine desulfurase sulfur acceptor subunit CsdE [Vibrio mediterranei]PRQ65943.1 cysteine desulfurase sulfur acceptor subunit CsdE [Vibrio mediterranei]PTC02506.1 cysteine desulfurase sulfur acceptor subunit CsdE [Vibrio mediterranei]